MIEAHLALAGSGSTRRALQARLILNKVNDALGVATDLRPNIEFRNNQPKTIQVQYKTIGGEPAFNWIFGAEPVEQILENKTFLDKDIKTAADTMLRKLGK